jgi:hypothetical protein
MEDTKKKRKGFLLQIETESGVTVNWWADNRRQVVGLTKTAIDNLKPVILTIIDAERWDGFMDPKVAYEAQTQANLNTYALSHTLNDGEVLSESRK